jgi:hypothetical protein
MNGIPMSSTVGIFFAEPPYFSDPNTSLSWETITEEI